MNPNPTTLNDLHDSILDLRDLAELQEELISHLADHELGDHDEYVDDCPVCDDEKNMILQALIDLEGELCVGTLERAAENEPTLIAASYFTEYAEEFADDIGAIDSNANWPICHIDWDAAADSLKMDFTEVTFDGRTYYWRGF